MLKRLVVGLLIGLVIGGLAATALIKGLGMALLVGGGGTALAYVFAALTGVVTGLVAGKPIWASGGQIEAGLKAVFGALLAAGAMFALRQWVHVQVPTLPMGIGGGELGQLPAAALPLIGAVLGGFYELDNTGTDAKDEKAKPGAKADAVKKRVAVDADEADDEAEAASKKAKR